MGYKALLGALSILVAVSPAPATQPEPIFEAVAPSAPPGARYCLRVEPVTGSRIEQVLCETREGWVELGVDLDKEWAEEGFRVETSNG